MRRINFTAEHMKRLRSLLTEMLFENRVIHTNFGNCYNAVELLHTVTINSLAKIKATLGKYIEELEGTTDEWIEDNPSQIEALKRDKELINLIIGYKRFILEIEDLKTKRKELKEQLKSLKESQKTPDEKIKEIEEKLAELD